MCMNHLLVVKITVTVAVFSSTIIIWGEVFKNELAFALCLPKFVRNQTLGY